MNLGTAGTAVPSALIAASVTSREAQICRASQAAEAAFERIAQTARVTQEHPTEFQDRVFSIFRWYFLSAFCTRLLSGAAHRMEHQTLQMSMDIISAVKMVLSDHEVEKAMSLVQKEQTCPTEVRANGIGARGHMVGWVAAGQHKKGRDFPKEIESALAGALAASGRLN